MRTFVRVWGRGAMCVWPAGVVLCARVGSWRGAMCACGQLGLPVRLTVISSEVEKSVRCRPVPVAPLACLRALGPAGLSLSRQRAHTARRRKMPPGICTLGSTIRPASARPLPYFRCPRCHPFEGSLRGCRVDNGSKFDRCPRQYALQWSLWPPHVDNDFAAEGFLQNSLFPCRVLTKSAF